ncbi:MAG: hypothetical protein KKF56_00520 [Nanoarchaeota archaeon]|nr:hypothetical protein [Nanoarchaeota archaeon]
MKFNILQYLPEKTKVKLPKNLVELLFNGKNLTQWSKYLDISMKNLSRYRNRSRSMPLKLFNKLFKISNLNLNNLQNKIELKLNNTGKFLNIGPTINIDKNWIYVSELIKGDSHINHNFWNISFTNKDKGLVDIIKNFFISLGLDKKRISLYNKKRVYIIIIRSSILAHIFNGIFGIPSGKKEETPIKEFILNKQEFAIAAVRAAFDAEGSITFTGSRRISISSNSKIWVDNLQEILVKLKIKSRVFKETKNRKTPIYRLFIYHIINLKKFNDIIQPLHKKRKEKLKEIIKNFKKKPTRVFHKDVLLSIQEGNQKRREIADYLNKDIKLIGNHISWMNKNQLIEPFEKIYTNRGSFFKYRITSKGKRYLEDSVSFFN